MAVLTKTDQHLKQVVGVKTHALPASFVFTVLDALGFCERTITVIQLFQRTLSALARYIELALASSNTLCSPMHLTVVKALASEGGELGIRTLETLLEPTHFPGVRLRPLGQLSFRTFPQTFCRMFRMIRPSFYRESSQTECKFNPSFHIPKPHSQS